MPATALFLLQFCLRGQNNLAAVLFTFIKNTIAFSRICQIHTMGNNHIRGKISIYNKFEQLRQELMHMGLPYFKGQALVKGITEQETVNWVSA